jgi:hypothetical protein
MPLSNLGAQSTPCAPGEIGVMITFPSSNNCAYINGLVVTVDAGLSADHEFFT